MVGWVVFHEVVEVSLASEPRNPASAGVQDRVASIFAGANRRSRSVQNGGHVAPLIRSVIHNFYS